jgi:lipopolysaccharide/colanic/teichoic acid biosynthesis glycosyltransferase
MTSDEISRELLAGRRAQLSAAAGSADGGQARCRQLSAGSLRRVVVVRNVLLPAADLLALTGAALLTESGWPAAEYLLVTMVAIGSVGLHRLRICLRLSDQMPRMAMAVLLPAVLLLPWLGSAGRVLRLAAVAVVLLAATRGTCYACLRAAHRRGFLTAPALVVGTGGLAVEVANVLLEHSEFGLRPVGFVGRRSRGPGLSLPVLGGIDNLGSLVRQHRGCLVIASFAAGADPDLVSVLRADPALPAPVYVVPRMYELGTVLPAASMDELWGIPLVRLRSRSMRAGRVAKRIFDITVGSSLLIALAPVLVAVLSAAWLLGGRPVLFRQTRVARDGGLMKITKVRTVASAEPDTQWTAVVATSRLRRWLRSTHLDELPQLIHVIRGDMSLVGPRPERPFFTARFIRLVPRYDDRHRVKGGVTGWAQVHGLTGDTSIPDRARFDNYYIEHWSMWLDVVILIRTIAAPVTGVRRQRRAVQQPPPWAGPPDVADGESAPES